MSDEQNNHAERIGKLETAFSNLAVSVNKLQEGQERIERAIADSGKTNWSVLFAGAGVLLSLVLVIYGAAIHPLNQDIIRQESNAKSLADAVVKQDESIVQLRIEQARQQDHLDTLIANVRHMNEVGTTDSDKRLTVIEWQMAHPQITPTKGSP